MAVASHSKGAGFMKFKFLLLALFFAPLLSVADNFESYFLYRDHSGKLTKFSLDNLKVLRNEAREHEQISVWIMFDMDFQPDPTLRTPDVVQAEADVKAKMIEDVVAPLWRDVKLLPTPAGLGGAPGVLLSVSEIGLVRLAHDKRVKHVGYQP